MNFKRRCQAVKFADRVRHTLIDLVLDERPLTPEATYERPGDLSLTCMERILGMVTE